MNEYVKWKSVGKCVIDSRWNGKWKRNDVEQEEEEEK